MAVVKLAVSPHFHNKTVIRPTAYGYGWQTVDWSVEVITRHVCSGKAICVAALKNDHRQTENFLASEIMGVDFDNGPDVMTLAKQDFIGKHAFLVYPTPSSKPDNPRSRVLFLLDSPIQSPDVYRSLILRLLAQLGNKPDEKCKDAVRLFYGSTLPGAWPNSEARLPLAVLEAMPEAAPQERPVIAVPVIAKGYANAALEKELSLLVSAQEGGRNDQLNKSAHALGQLVGAGELDRYTVESALTNGGLSLGLAESEVRATVRSGLNAGIAQPRVIPVMTPHANGTKPESAIPQADKPPRLVTSSELSKEYTRHLLKDEDALPITTVQFPLRSLHSLGGVAQLVEAGQLVGIVGVSGTGKTSMLETLIDAWQERGVHILMWSPEWKPTVFKWRQCYRYGGPTVTAMQYNALYKANMHAVGVPGAGRRLSDDEQLAGSAAGKRVDDWPGEIIYLAEPQFNLAQIVAGVDYALDTQACKPQVVIIDYAQLLQAMERDEPSMYSMLMRLKTALSDRNLIGVVATQTTKADARNSTHQFLDAASARYVNDDAFNLFITLNLEYDEVGNRTNTGVLNVCKNSTGKVGKVRIYHDLARFCWVDKLAESQEFPR